MLAFIRGSRTVQRIIASAEGVKWITEAWEAVLTSGTMPEKWCKHVFNRAAGSEGLPGGPSIGQRSSFSGPMLIPGQRLERRAQRWPRLADADQNALAT